ncbi:septum formation protein Maf [Clostridia bacterium]|nr:septum formation protein Maf [Clostridia bacterium]
MKIILASGSPRRLEILKKHGIDPVVVPSDADETLPPEYETRSLDDIVRYLAHIKARAVYEQLTTKGESSIFTHEGEGEGEGEVACEPTMVLGADTIVYKDFMIGKPVDEADAFRILSHLRNSEHLVITGVCLIDLATGEETQFAETTRVFFKDYPDEEIRRFLREEPPYDKSGSYAIQSSWTKNVDRIEGELENVIGLPWRRLAAYITD